MSVAQRRQMARLERLATRLLNRKSKQLDSRSPIDKELYGIEPRLLSLEEMGELVELCKLAKDFGGGSSALPTASRERFRDLIAKATPKRQRPRSFCGARKNPRSSLVPRSSGQQIRGGASARIEHQCYAHAHKFKHATFPTLLSLGSQSPVLLAPDRIPIMRGCEPSKYSGPWVILIDIFAFANGHPGPVAPASMSATARSRFAVSVALRLIE